MEYFWRSYGNYGIRVQTISGVNLATRSEEESLSRRETYARRTSVINSLSKCVRERIYLFHHSYDVQPVLQAFPDTG